MRKLTRRRRSYAVLFAATVVGWVASMAAMYHLGRGDGAVVVRVDLGKSAQLP
jgi:hypothetical protein